MFNLGYSVGLKINCTGDQLGRWDFYGLAAVNDAPILRLSKL